MIRAVWNGVVLAETPRNAAWYYPNPSPLTRRIKNHIAFRHDIEVVGEPE